MPWGRSWLIGGGAGLSNLGLYLVFTADVGLREIFAGIVVAGLATAAAIVFSVASATRFDFRLRDLMQAWRLPWTLVSDAAKTLQALAMQLVGRRGVPSVLAAVAFDGGENKPGVDAGRCALAITYNSAAPNSILLGIVEVQGLMIYHQLIPGPLSPMIRDMGAKP
jgi:hypothetical protein